MATAQVTFRPDRARERPDGLRARKKAKTRLAIEDAALSLFEQQGYEATTVDDIAERAEVSKTTFFRYFPTKAEVVLSGHGEQLPALQEAILDQAVDVSDLDVVRRAIQREWIGAIDPERTARKARITASSDVLSGLSFDRGHRWLRVIADALARRRGLDAPDKRASLTARVALGVLAAAVDEWIASGCVGNLADEVDDRFELMDALCAEWSNPE